MKLIHKIVSVFSFVGVCCMSATIVFGAEGTLSQLKSMSLENLMQIEVFSASLKDEQLSAVASAVYVIDREDIRRSGALTLPELLRGVPGIDVIRVDSHTWMISARGFNGLFANKLLVLMDGRTLYTPLFSGVYWDMQDTLLEDIERIEIIRGPGATVWGANAVNGVINIMTRHADDTGGGFVRTGGATPEEGLLSGRIGQNLGNFSYRVFGKALEQDGYEAASGGDLYDNWKEQIAGFRMDWQTYTGHELTLSGDLYRGEGNQQIKIDEGAEGTGSYDDSGGYLQLQWQKQTSERSHWSLQSYLDRNLRDDLYVKQGRTIWDLSLTHVYDLSDARQSLVWGGGYRYSSDNTSFGLYSGLDPAAVDEELFSLFVQDDITLIDESLHLILGSKFEHNDYTGFEVQPNMRLVWTPSARQTVWGAVSRAVRTPSRMEFDTRFYFEDVNAYGTYAAIGSGNRDFKSEELLAYELGYRLQLNERFSVDLALFYNDYDNLRVDTQRFVVVSYAPLVVEVPMSFSNDMTAESYGAELSAKWTPVDLWRLNFGYSWLKMFFHYDASEAVEPFYLIEESTPEHQLSLKSYVDLPYDLEWDTFLYYFSSYNDVDAHLRCDIRLGWQPSDKWELSVKVESLFDDSYRESYDGYGVVSGEVPRTFFAEVKYRF